MATRQRRATPRAYCLTAQYAVVIIFLFAAFSALWLFSDEAIAGDVVRIGLNYPETGPYAAEGLDQIRAAKMAVEELNSAGGILGHKIELAVRDSGSNVDKTKSNVTELIEKEGVKMVFGGSSSAVAIAASELCQAHWIPFFGTLTYSTATTGEDGHRVCFRECYDGWMGAKVMGDYLNRNFKGKRYLYITADYTWGWTTEESVRASTNTTDENVHKGVRTKLGTEDFTKELKFAKMVKPDVLVVVLFGKDMVNCLRQATLLGLKTDCQVVVPNLTLGMASGAGPKVMEGVIGAVPWTWRVPGKYGYERGKTFVDDFVKRYGRYPSTSAASAYTILYEYKAAAERAGSFETVGIVKALEGHSYQLLKDLQTWRDFDHQSIQTVYMVKCKPAAEVLKDPLKLDYFEIIHSMPGGEAARTYEEWKAIRIKAGKEPALEHLPGA
jgi:branched-chain amino acid transport system substrate-binding protein